MRKPVFGRKEQRDQQERPTASFWREALLIAPHNTVRIQALEGFIKRVGSVGGFKLGAFPADVAQCLAVKENAGLGSDAGHVELLCKYGVHREQLLNTDAGLGMIGALEELQAFR